MRILLRRNSSRGKPERVCRGDIMRSTVSALPFLLILLSVACAHQATIVPFQSQPPASPNSPESVGIYRQTNPFDKFRELGLITFKTGVLDMPRIYQELREDAGAQGADAVVDVKVKGETHTEWQTVTECTPVTDCDANGSCQTHDECHEEQVPEEVSTYAVEGSMIRRSL